MIVPLNPPFLPDSYGKHVYMDSEYPWLQGHKLIEPYVDTTLRVTSVSRWKVRLRVSDWGGAGMPSRLSLSRWSEQAPEIASGSWKIGVERLGGATGRKAMRLSAFRLRLGHPG